MSAFVTVNDVPCFKADVMRPRIGNWHADLVVNSRKSISGAVTLAIGDSVKLSGYVLRGGVHHETLYLRVQGGAGGLGTELAPRSYRNVPVRLALSDALREAGETLSAKCDPNAIQRFLPAWVRLRQSAGAELGRLRLASGAEAWRVLPDGSIWIGAESWQPTRIKYQHVEFEPQIGRLEFVSDDPIVYPGETWVGEETDGRRISSVRHVVAAEKIRHFVMFEEEGDLSDRTKAGLDALLRTSVQPGIDAAAIYRAKVISQNADGTLELRPDSSKLPDLSAVPIRSGIPASVKVAVGARALVQFADGDLTFPIVTGWEATSADEIALAGGTGYVALASLVNQRLADLKSAISGAACTAGDGGAAFKANIVLALASINPSWPASTAATKVKAA